MVSHTYIHIPFCSHKCDFCDFAAFAGVDHLTDEYEQVVLKEIDDRLSALEQKRGDLSQESMKSVFFGGGTPGLVEPRILGSMLEKLNSYIKPAADCEITIETTPHAITRDKLEQWKSFGINRISVGVESFLDEELKAMGRDHYRQEAFQGLELACQSGVDVVGLDLMYGLPTQSVESFAKSLECAVDFTSRFKNLRHVSAYGLHLADNSPLYSRFPKGAAAYPADNIYVQMFELLVETLERAGFEHYEVSNFARPGSQSRHNMAYWKNAEYLAFGVSAHRYLDGVRTSNWRSLKRYMRDWLGDETVDVIDESTRLRESIMLGLRLRRGIDLKVFEQEHGFDLSKRFRSEIEKFADAGLLEQCDGRLYLTKKGVPVSNSVISAFF
ncbi:MAG TPA: radical SAM family heme chaperone HemW [Candidatus Melainabacteria bacterium]|jgi:oxygen-independent coproporphyrinogen III oxidase|nr:radical SAM family heme chaperone HemW [Candidatus Melainabacteria bacterium]HIN64747.1 radical SAM family heme chaperone HemW [Candidatus Obscuribacterales bacterium]